MFRPSDFFLPPGQDHCPQCFSRNIRWLSGFYKRMFGQVVSKQRFRCADCGRQWTVREGAPASQLRAAAGGAPCPKCCLEH